MPGVYSTHPAKAKFSEILRKVRAGQRVIITFRGAPLAEVRPVQRSADEEFRARLKRIEEEGVLTLRPLPRKLPEPVARIPGALARFLRERV